MAEFRACYRHADARAGVSCQRCGNPICPDCMRQASVGFHCPACTKSDGQRILTPGSLLVDPLVTKTLIAVNVMVFLSAMLVPSINEAINGRGEGLLFGPLVADGEYWRIITSGFLHASVLHIGFNMWLLWQLGGQVESRIGHIRFGLLYLVGLLGGSLLVLIISPNQPTLGASGAVFGLMAATAVNQISQKLNPMDTGIGALVGMNLVFTFLFPGISIGGHLGGLIAGAAAGAVISYGARVVPVGATIAALAGLAVAAAGASLVVVGVI